MEQLQTVVPHLPPEFPSVLFLKRPGLVTYHIRRDGTLVATLSVSDLEQKEPALREMFRGAKQRVHGYPAIQTSMGGGIAVLVADRFRVEVVSLGPAVGEKRRDAWLNAFDFSRLAAMGNVAQ